MVSNAPNSSNDRTYHDTDSAYVLPNDSTEHERLDFQANCLRILGGNKVFHAPLTQTTLHKTLEVGCGTGITTDELASKFPNAQIYGVDLSPVPELREKRQNITYIQGDVNELARPVDPDARFKPASFDYIFSRLLVLGMTDWSAYIARCVSLLKPGGYLEMHDVDTTTYRAPTTPEARSILSPHMLTFAQLRTKSHPADSWKYSTPYTTALDKLMRIEGLESHAGALLAEYFDAAGLVDIHIKRIMLPIGGSEDSWGEGFLTEQERLMSVHTQRFTIAAIGNALRKMAAAAPGVVGEEELEEAVKSTREDSQGDRVFYLFYVVYGRKAG